MHQYDKNPLSNFFKTAYKAVILYKIAILCV